MKVTDVPQYVANNPVSPSTMRKAAKCRRLAIAESYLRLFENQSTIHVRCGYAFAAACTEIIRSYDLVAAHDRGYEVLLGKALLCITPYLGVDEELEKSYKGTRHTFLLIEEFASMWYAWHKAGWRLFDDEHRIHVKVAMPDGCQVMIGGTYDIVVYNINTGKYAVLDFKGIKSTYGYSFSTDPQTLYYAMLLVVTGKLKADEIDWNMCGYFIGLYKAFESTTELLRWQPTADSVADYAHLTVIHEALTLATNLHRAATASKLTSLSDFVQSIPGNHFNCHSGDNFSCSMYRFCHPVDREIDRAFFHRKDERTYCKYTEASMTYAELMTKLEEVSLCKNTLSEWSDAEDYKFSLETYYERRMRERRTAVSTGDASLDFLASLGFDYSKGDSTTATPAAIPAQTVSSAYDFNLDSMESLLRSLG